MFSRPSEDWQELLVTVAMAEDDEPVLEVATRLDFPGDLVLLIMNGFPLVMFTGDGRRSVVDLITGVSKSRGRD